MEQIKKLNISVGDDDDDDDDGGLDCADSSQDDDLGHEEHKGASPLHSDGDEGVSDERMKQGSDGDMAQRDVQEGKPDPAQNRTKG